MRVRPEAAIIDVDGTVVDVSSIRHLVDKSHPQWPGKNDFDGFHHQSINCPPIPSTLELVQEQQSRGRRIVIVTARGYRYRHLTMFHLHEMGVEWDDIFFRDDHDARPDYDVKKDILHESIMPRYVPVIAVDDNPSVIRLWREHDIETIVVPGWDHVVS